MSAKAPRATGLVPEPCIASVTGSVRFAIESVVAADCTDTVEGWITAASESARPLVDQTPWAKLLNLTPRRDLPGIAELEASWDKDRGQLGSFRNQKMPQTSVVVQQTE